MGVGQGSIRPTDLGRIHEARLQGQTAINHYRRTNSRPWLIAQRHGCMPPYLDEMPRLVSD